jgi:hypothetical protein
VPFLHRCIRMRALVASCLALSACADPSAVDDDDGGGKADGTGHEFTEVDRAHSSSSFRTYIRNALDELEANGGQLARLTLTSIEVGRVQIDELADLTCPDFLRVLNDFPDLPYTAADWPRLHDRDSDVATTITSELDGYMWSNRIYVGRGQRSLHLAATLVHEVNHVINRSEQGYYDDLPTSAFREEYRAFDAERRFAPELWEGVDLVDYVITEYELDRAKIDPAQLATPLTPRLWPSAAAWKDRDVASDVEDLACP